MTLPFAEWWLWKSSGCGRGEAEKMRVKKRSWLLGASLIAVVVVVVVVVVAISPLLILNPVSHSLVINLQLILNGIALLLLLLLITTVYCWQWNEDT